MAAKTLETTAGISGVRRLLRHRNSKKYFKDGGWTHDPGEASCFSNALEAAAACARYQLDNVELALRFNRGSSDFFSTPLR